VNGFILSESWINYRFKEKPLEVYHSRFAECKSPDKEMDLFLGAGGIVGRRNEI
jgi:hypothetical protein